MINITTNVGAIPCVYNDFLFMVQDSNAIEHFNKYYIDYFLLFISAFRILAPEYFFQAIHHK